MSVCSMFLGMVSSNLPTSTVKESYHILNGTGH